MSDALSLLAIQGGLISTPQVEQAAEAATDLCIEQRLMRIGDPLPIVFTRRQGGLGGCLVSPGATEARFENSPTNELTASWHLVLGEGPMDPIQARDVFQCACRVGTSTQAFNHRAGSWQPGNFTVDRGGSYQRWEVPRYCGAPGSYEGLTTLSFVNTHQDGEEFNRQIHVFSRGGRHVPRLIDGTTGPSCNVVDLYLYLLRTVERVPEDLISIPSLTRAARFQDSLGLRWDGLVGKDQTENLDDWAENVLKPYFLLARSRVYGQEGLTPLLPVHDNGALYLGPVSPSATLTEKELDLSTWSLEFLSTSDRRPMCAQMQWRQQDDGIDSIVRTTPVRFAPPYDAPDGPFEQHDMSRFATSERHVVKVGAYGVAHRALCTHTLEVDAKPGEYLQQIGEGSVVRVKVPITVEGQSSDHDYLYRVSSLGNGLDGEVKLNLVHLPLDGQGRSAISIAVYNTQPSGVLLPIIRSGPVCDVNSSTNDTPLGEDLADFPLYDDGIYNGENPYAEIPYDDLPLGDDVGGGDGRVTISAGDGGGGGGDGPAIFPEEPELPELPPPPDQPPPGGPPNDNPDQPPSDPGAPPGSPQPPSPPDGAPPGSGPFGGPFTGDPTARRNKRLRISWTQQSTHSAITFCADGATVQVPQQNWSRTLIFTGRGVGASIVNGSITANFTCGRTNSGNLPTKWQGVVVWGVDDNGLIYQVKSFGGYGPDGSATSTEASYSWNITVGNLEVQFFDEE